jgi:glycosyltransferase involved in cell wall biosynthesis
MTLPLRASPAVSVIVPVHNAAATIEATLASLFTQTLDNLEVVAVDDASRDASAEVLNRIAAREPRLKVLRLERNVGVHEARVAGLRAAQAPWIGFVDADDFARPQMYASLLDAADEYGVDVVVCGADRVTQARQRLGSKTSFAATRRIDDALLQRYCRLEFGNGSLCNKLYRATLIQRWGLRSFRWRQDMNEDTLVNLAVFFDARSVCLLPLALYEYTFNPTSATSSADHHRAFTLLLRAYALAIDQFADEGSDVLESIIALYRRQIDYDCYRLPDGAWPPQHDAALHEAVALLAHRYPPALALLAARLQQPGLPDAAAPAATGVIQRLRRALSRVALRG